MPFGGRGVVPSQRLRYKEIARTSVLLIVSGILTLLVKAGVDDAKVSRIRFSAGCDDANGNHLACRRMLYAVSAWR